jgi:hypothetical protein
VGFAGLLLNRISFRRFRNHRKDVAFSRAGKFDSFSRLSLSPTPPPLHPLSLYGKCPPTTSNKMLKISFEASLDSKDVLSLFSHSFPAARLSYPFFSFLADPGRKRSRANGAISKAPRHDSFNVSIVYSRSHTQYSNRFFRRISRPRILILCL